MNELINGLKKSRRKQLFYIICRLILLLIILLPGVFGVEVLLVNMEKEYNIRYEIINGMIFTILFLGIVIFIVKRITKMRQLNKRGVVIEAKFSLKEFASMAPSASMPGKYVIVAYYIKNNVTYRFSQLFFEDQLKVYNIIRVIGEKGEFPTKINVKVDARNYQNYKIFGYEFLEETLKKNKSVVEQEVYGINVF